MSSPFPMREQDSMQLMPSAPAADEDLNGIHNIPRRLMQVKVLYTFDDQNKSNCLARLPGAMNVPTVAVDEATEVGVIELRACIRAIVAASPELVAKLGHDYTVYAYDFSEYETPLVGQGMLSRILASASTTPNAPADQSETMVTGRVCKNILGLFTNGIKETLEVKLKLIPVPTCLQREYVENMERYHSLSQIMPEGLDYSAWVEFLRSNPTIAQLTHPGSQQSAQFGQRESMGPMGHTNAPPQQPMTRLEHTQQPHMPYNSYGTRPSSPALSTVSFSHYQHSQDTRPVSRASCRSENMAPTHIYQPVPRPAQEQQEEGPAKKRARVTKAARPKKTPLVATTESLRVAASTAASVRLHRPAITPSISDMASAEQVPRAPTPRPSGRSFAQSSGRPRGPAPSLLRHASMDEGRSFPSPCDSAMFSDNAVDSADEERGNSPAETPMDMPSSPPVMPERLASSVPSSPGLPSLPYPPDSGFVSDMTSARDDEATKAQAWEGSDVPTAPDTRTRRTKDRSQSPWTVVTPGPVELLPKSYIPKPRTFPRPQKMEKASKNVPPLAGTELSDVPEIPDHMIDPQLPTLNNRSEYYREDSVADASEIQADGRQERVIDAATSMHSAESRNQTQKQLGCEVFQHPDVRSNHQVNDDTSRPPLRASTPNAAPKPTKTSHARGLPRSQTWSGEPMSDAAFPEPGSRLPRSGSGAKRRQLIADQLAESLAKGVMPAYCNHCGEIETPTWRKAYTRVEKGLPIDVQLSSDGNGIVAYDVIEPSADDQYSPKYRIFKQALDKTEKDGGTFQQVNLCNPCGLWLNKKNAMRPAELWGPKKPLGEKPKRKRNPPKGPRKKAKGLGEDIHSDAIVPHSEPIMPASDAKQQTSNEESTDGYMQQSTRYRSCSSQLPDHPNGQLDNTTAMAALHRAIESSPGCAGSKESPINVEPELTPKPTRRLLFPSPRRTGEKKLLDENASVSPSAKFPSRTSAPLAVQIFNPEDMDKENCPPPAGEDDLAHLFEDKTTPKSTPRNDAVMQDLLKTPTPASRRRTPLGSKRGTDINAGGAPRTPSRIILTPSRNGRAATIAPETPFTRQLNAMLSDCLSSPSQAIDFSAFSPFSLTPGRNGAIFVDYNLHNDFLSSDLPIPSSPSGPGFALFEDPATSTVGLWSGASIFEDSDAVGVDGQQLQQQGGEGADQTVLSLKTTAISVDFAAMIDGAVGGGHDKENVDVNEVEKENQGPAGQGKLVSASTETVTEAAAEAT